MIRCISALMIAAILWACGPTAENDVATQAPQLTGKQAYEQTCASCHDDGADGAPMIGDRDAWKGRSQLWQAVLIEHAKSGYMDMPAMGGSESLDDATVARAAEYMLTTTFPEFNKD